MDLTLITTGGTIDGADLETGGIRPESALLEFVKQDASLTVKSHALFNKDSRELTEQDRTQLLSLIQESSSDKILVGHGTFTICETGRFLKKNLAETSKSVLLIGSWIPFGNLDSDAPQQAKNALNFLKAVPQGVFIAMDGKLWDPDLTDKQKINGQWQLGQRAQ